MRTPQEGEKTSNNRLSDEKTEFRMDDRTAPEHVAASPYGDEFNIRLLQVAEKNVATDHENKSESAPRRAVEGAGALPILPQ
jgi:hypothetical protein